MILIGGVISSPSTKIPIRKTKKRKQPLGICVSHLFPVTFRAKHDTSQFAYPCAAMHTVWNYDHYYFMLIGADTSNHISTWCTLANPNHPSFSPNTDGNWHHCDTFSSTHTHALARLTSSYSPQWKHGHQKNSKEIPKRAWDIQVNVLWSLTLQNYLNKNNENMPIELIHFFHYIYPRCWWGKHSKIVHPY